MADKKRIVHSIDRDLTACAPPRWLQKKNIKKVKVIEVTQEFELYSNFYIEYDNTFSKTFQGYLRPSDNEIEAYCSGVDAERERFLAVLGSICDDETMKKIDSYQAHLLKRSEVQAQTQLLERSGVNGY